MSPAGATSGSSGPKTRHEGRIVADYIDGHAEANLPQQFYLNVHNSGMYIQKTTYTYWLDDEDGSGAPHTYTP